MPDPAPLTREEIAVISSGYQFNSSAEAHIIFRLLATLAERDAEIAALNRHIDRLGHPGAR